MTFTLITISVTCFDTNTRIMADNDQERQTGTEANEKMNMYTTNVTMFRLII